MESDGGSAGSAGSGGSGILKFVLVGQVLLLAALGALIARTEKAVQAGQAAAREASAAKKEIAGLKDDLEVLASSVGDLQRNINELAEKITLGGGGLGGGDGNAPPAQPFQEFTPEQRAKLVEASAAKGIRLLEDRVVVPGRVVLRGGALEFLAVFRGGKAHESIFVLTGTPDAEGKPPEGMGASLNACLMALDLRPGTPTRMLPGGRTVPGKGATIHVSVEWEEGGRKVRVRAEDLVWDRPLNRPMQEGKFVYAGSYFATEGYVPDLTGDGVAVYSVPTCVVDLDDPRAADDTIFMACTPRIPAEDTKVDLVFSPKPLEPTRTWSESDARLALDEGNPSPAPAAPAGGGEVVPGGPK